MSATEYRTAAGSTVTRGRGGTTTIIRLDWIEEGACVEASPYADISDPAEPWLRWECACCGEGRARLFCRGEAAGGGAVNTKRPPHP